VKTGTKLGLALAPLLAPGILHGLFLTCRKIHIGSRAGYDLSMRRVSRVCALWHQRIFFMLQEHMSRHPIVMVSQSKDGEIIARVMHRLGYALARGSSSRGGKEALDEVIDFIRAGGYTGMVADGPRGPARVLKMGSVIAARETGTPLCGVTAVASKHRFARSWDRTEIPMPFSTIVYGYTEPFRVPPNATNSECEQYRVRLERELNAMDDLCAARAKQFAL
jgi:lysophospholipid acyltransferase (LPLAT)-like uncharacterized protein